MTTRSWNLDVIAAGNDPELQFEAQKLQEFSVQLEVKTISRLTWHSFSLALASYSKMTSTGCLN